MMLPVIAVAVVVVLIVIWATVCWVGNLGAAAVHGGNTEAKIEIAWPSESYPENVISECVRFVRKGLKGNFGPATKEEAAAYEAEARRIKIPVEALLQMRTIEIAVRARKTGTRILRAGPEMLRASAEGESVLSIARRLDLPPTLVMRQILIESGVDSAEAKKLVSGPNRAGMPARLAAEADQVCEADLGSRYHSELIREKSRVFETRVATHLSSLGIKFKTEDEIRKKPGVLLTPDFLLDEPVLINGKLVCWIDAKNYLAYPNKLVDRSLTKQAEKYNRAFGPGAMVFSGGVSGASQRDVLLLDGSHIR